MVSSSSICSFVVLAALLLGCDSGVEQVDVPAQGATAQKPPAVRPEVVAQPRTSVLKPLTMGGDLLLHTRREKTVPGKPEWITRADVDGDGSQEVLAATNSPGALLLWREAGARHETIVVGDFPLRPVGLGGAEESAQFVAVASRAESDVTLLNLRAPNSPQVLWQHELEDSPMVLASGVLDGARGPELFVVSRHGTLSRASKDGVWTSQDLEPSMPRCALVLESGGDLVIGFQSSDTLEVFHQGTGEALEWRTRHQLPGTPRDLLSIDVDSDGDLELVAVEGDEGGWILGVGGTDPFDPDVPALLFRTTAIPLRLLPLKSGESASWTVLAAKSVAAEIWDWTSEGPERRLFSYAGQTPADIVVSVAGGQEALWVANRDAHRISILRLSPEGPIQPGKTAVGTFPNDIATGDISGDGLPEVFVINAKDNEISVLGRGGQAQLVPKFRVQTGPSPRAVLCADIDSNGTQDLLWMERVAAGTRLSVRLGDDQMGLKVPGGFEPLPVGLGCRDFIVETFPGEPRAVVVATDQDGRKLRWTTARAQAGRLSFEAQGELTLPGPPRAITTIKFQGVARAIVVAVQITVGRSRVQLYTPVIAKNAPLRWQLQSELELEGAVQDLASADMDGDGIDDVGYLAADREGTTGGRFQPLLVKGGKLKPVGRFSTGLRAQRILAADFSGDGRAEVFVANLDSHNVNVWLATGPREGLVFKPLDDVGAGVGCIALDAFDFEGDGDLDLLVVDSANDGVSLILNEAR